MDNNKSNDFDNIPQLEPIDIKELFYKILKYWKYILLSIFVFVISGYFVNRYSTRMYTSKAIILIQEPNTNFSGGISIMEGLGFSNPRLNYFNEKLTLESRSQLERTFKNIDFDISYYTSGNVKSYEVYKPNIFKIEFDKSHPQIVDALFNVEIIDHNRCIISLDADEEEKLNVYDFNNNIILKSISNNLINKEFKIGEWIESSNYKFKVVLYDTKFREDFQFKFNSLESLIQQYKKSLNIHDAMEESAGMILSITGPIPQKNEDFIDAFADTYIKYGLDLKNTVSDNTLKFIDNQIRVVQDSLNFAESLMQKFRSDNKLVDLGETGTMMFGNLMAIEDDISKEKFKLSYYESIYNSMKSNMGSDEITAPSAMGIDDPLLNSSIANLISLYSQKTQLKASSYDNSPQIVNIDNQISQTKDLLVENLGNIIKNSKVFIGSLNEKKKEYEDKIKQLPKTEQSYFKIERRFKLSEGLYNFLIEKRAEAGIVKAGNVADNKIIDYAISDMVPIAPKPKLIYAVSLMLGLIVPIVLILIFDFLDNKIKNRNQIESVTSIPVLGVIGFSNYDSNLVVRDAPKSVISEGFRSLRTNLRYLLKKDDKSKVILVTSSISAEGKTFISMNLATVFAHSKKKTIILGVDLRRQKIFSELSNDNSKGLSTYLAGIHSSDEIIKSTPIDFLDVIPAGPTPPNPSELLLDSSLGLLIEELRSKYQYIILDTAPIGLVSDAMQLLDFSDLNLFVVRHNYTEVELLNFIDQKYKNNMIKNLSIVVNSLPLDETRGYYGYGYSYGYGYGYGYYDESENGISKMTKKLKKLLKK
jgi:tyrosine-protein kinase Etk/Wzc